MVGGVVRGIRGREWLGEWSGGQEGWVRCIRGSGQGHKRRSGWGSGQEDKRDGSGA